VSIVLLQIAFYRIEIRGCLKKLCALTWEGGQLVCYRIWDLDIWTYHLIKINNKKKDNYAYFGFGLFWTYHLIIEIMKMKKNKKNG